MIMHETHAAGHVPATDPEITDLATAVNFVRYRKAGQPFGAAHQRAYDPRKCHETTDRRYLFDIKYIRQSEYNAIADCSGGANVIPRK